jgi:hypothetical protein
VIELKFEEVLEKRRSIRARNEEKIISTGLTGFTLNLSIGLSATFTLYILSGYLSNQVFINPELKPIIQILSLMVLARARAL